MWNKVIKFSLKNWNRIAYNNLWVHVAIQQLGGASFRLFQQQLTINEKYIMKYLIAWMLHFLDWQKQEVLTVTEWSSLTWQTDEVTHVRESLSDPAEGWKILISVGWVYQFNLFFIYGLVFIKGHKPAWRIEMCLNVFTGASSEEGILISSSYTVYKPAITEVMFVF